jgi:hypothetical protein
MAEKARIGFSLDFKDSQKQLENIIKALNSTKDALGGVGKEGSKGVKELEGAVKSTFTNISNISKNLRKSIQGNAQASRSSLKGVFADARRLTEQLSVQRGKTAKEVEKSEGKKRAAFEKTLEAQKKAIKETEKLADVTSTALKKQENAFKGLETVVLLKLGVALKDLIKDSTLLAARNEVLGTAMRVVGTNMGFTNAELSRAETTIRGLGISIQDTRTLISRFAQNQLGLANATKLAAAAQDLAAGSTLGSSEALQIMTNSITSLLPRQLRQFGVVVDLNQVYANQARILNKTAQELTPLEKRQGLLNIIFEEAAKRAGAYERSMEDVGKVLTSLSSRIIPDTLSVFGESFLPIFSEVIFAVKDLLEFLQELPEGLKTVVTSVVAFVAVLALLKSAIIAAASVTGLLLQGTLTAAAGYAGATAALNPYILALGALAAALVILPALFKDAANAQQEAADASREALNIQEDRLEATQKLRETLDDENLTQEELNKIIRNNISRQKELIPFLNQENVSREEIIKVLDKEIEAGAKVVESKRKTALESAEANLERLKNEQFVTGELIQLSLELREKFGEDIPMRDLVLSFKTFRESLSDANQKTLETLDLWDDFVDSDFKKLERNYKDLGDTIEDVNKDIATGFEKVAESTEASVSDMEQSFLKLSAQLDKLGEGTTKKFPFRAIIAEQEKFNDSIQNTSLTAQRRNELITKANQIFQDKFVQAELKFREKLESIGASRLDRIDARVTKERTINEGSQVAIQAIEAQAAADRNAIFEGMWSSRLSTIGTATNNIIQAIRQQRDLAYSSFSGRRVECKRAICTSFFCSVRTVV